MFRKLYGRPYKSSTINTLTTNYGAVAYAYDSPDVVLTEWQDGMTNFLDRIRSIGRTGETLKPEYFGVDPANISEYEDEQGIVNALYSAIRIGVFSNEPKPYNAVTVDGTTYYCYTFDWVISASGTAARYKTLLTSSATSYSEINDAYYPAGGTLRSGYSSLIGLGAVLPADFKVGLTYSKHPTFGTNGYRWVFSCPSIGFFETYDIDARNVYFEYSETGEEGDEPTVIDFPALPSISVLQTGFISLYRMDLGSNGLNGLASAMWGSTFLDALHKFFGDDTPYEAIISLSIFPWANNIPSGTSQTLKIGNVTMGSDYGTISGEKITQQFYDVMLGSTTVPEYYHNSLDYAPHTKVELYLPAVGMVQLPVSVVMGKCIAVKYRIDLLSGDLCAMIAVYNDTNMNSGIGVFQCHTGNIRCMCPISASDGSNLFNTLLQGASTGRASLSKHMFKEDVMQYGSYAGNKAMLNTLDPILYIRRPTDVTPTGFNLYHGFVTNQVLALGTLSGFTQVEDIALGIAGASKEDLEEIETLLKEGVYL